MQIITRNLNVIIACQGDNQWEIPENNNTILADNYTNDIQAKLIL